MSILTHENPTLTLTLTLTLLLSIPFLCRPILAQPGPTDPNAANQNFSPSMGVIIIVLIAALFFMGFFSIYIRHCTEVTTTSPGVRTRRIITGSIARSRRAPRGLDPAVIENFPTFDYASVKTAKIGKGALECAVCLTEFEDDDTLRLIPKCDHVFHPECIDTWLAAHTTCPVCRANLTEPAIATDSTDVQNDAVLDVVTENVIQNNEYDTTTSSNNNNDDGEEESMERPLQGRMRKSRSMMRNISFGRPRWMGKFTRSFSTGHVAVKEWENMDRFTLRLPNDIRKQIICGKLERSTSLVVLPRETSTRRGYRVGFGEGTSRVRSGSVRSDYGRSDRWVFSLAPPFISRAPSVRSPKGVVPGGVVVSRDGSVRGSIKGGSLRGSLRSDSTRLPV